MEHCAVQYSTVTVIFSLLVAFHWRNIWCTSGLNEWIVRHAADSDRPARCRSPPSISCSGERHQLLYCKGVPKWPDLGMFENPVPVPDPEKVGSGSGRIQKFWIFTVPGSGSSFGSGTGSMKKRSSSGRIQNFGSGASLTVSIVFHASSILVTWATRTHFKYSDRTWSPQVNRARKANLCKVHYIMEFDFARRCAIASIHITAGGWRSSTRSCTSHCWSPRTSERSHIHYNCTLASCCRSRALVHSATLYSVVFVKLQ